MKVNLIFFSLFLVFACGKAELPKTGRNLCEVLEKQGSCANFQTLSQSAPMRLTNGSHQNNQIQSFDFRLSPKENGLYLIQMNPNYFRGALSSVYSLEFDAQRHFVVGPSHCLNEIRVVWSEFRSATDSPGSHPFPGTASNRRSFSIHSDKAPMLEVLLQTSLSPACKELSISIDVDVSAL
jgi:hypothetical protein